jgi:hypothetical protein
VADFDDNQGGAQGMAGKSRASASTAKLPIPTLQTARALILMNGRIKGERGEVARGESVLAEGGFSAGRNHAVGQERSPTGGCSTTAEPSPVASRR